MADVADVGGLRSAAQPAAPHGGRLVAFGLDLAVVLLLSLVLGGGWLRLIGVFVAYHTALVWLTGQTIGKAVANLQVRRVDGRAFERTAKGLVWTLGRSSVGYLLVDMLGLGALVALPRSNTERRCLHDIVFGSRVVLLGETDWALPKMRTRLSDFATRRESASRAVGEAQETPRRLKNLWHWMVTGALGLEKVLDVVQDIVTQVSSWFGGAGHAHAGTATLTTKTAAGVAVASGTVTAATVTLIAVTAGAPVRVGVPELTPVGTWGAGTTQRVVVVRKTGSKSYVGRNANDYQEAKGCIFKAHDVTWEFEGDVDYRGTAMAIFPELEGPCPLVQSPAVFGLYDQGTDDPTDDVLKVCIPAEEVGVEECDDFTRR